MRSLRHSETKMKAGYTPGTGK